MKSIQLDPGLYTNVFEVRVPNDPVTVIVAPSAKYPDLRPLREEISRASWNCRVYRVGDRVFGYGEQRELLASKSFRPEMIRLQDEPALCGRLIQEGLADYLKNQGYREWSGKGRVTLYEPKPYRELVGPRLRVYRGYDLRTLWRRQDEDIVFGLVVDVCWEIQDSGGQRLSPSGIAQYNAMRQVAQIQEELLPTGQINTEVARLRLQNHILPFVRAHGSFSLPCGGDAKIGDTPMRVVLGG